MNWLKSEHFYLFGRRTRTNILVLRAVRLFESKPAENLANRRKFPNMFGRVRWHPNRTNTNTTLRKVFGSVRCPFAPRLFRRRKNPPAQGDGRKEQEQLFDLGKSRSYNAQMTFHEIVGASGGAQFFLL